MPGAFLLACEKEVAIYERAHLGQARQVFATPAADFVREPSIESSAGSSRGSPLWKAWCRPHRRVSDIPNPEEHLYIAREDGCVCLLTVQPGSYSTHHGGQLRCFVNDAFNHDGRGLDAPDGLICGGSLSDGGIYEASSYRMSSNYLLLTLLAWPNQW